jgi:hypothetical protein
LAAFLVLERFFSYDRSCILLLLFENEDIAKTGVASNFNPNQSLKEFL